MARNKYGNEWAVLDGEKFQSKAEMRRWAELKLLERAGEISGLERQPRFELVPKQPGERAVVYIADFAYFDKEGRTIVEDVKGHKTKDYVIKRKLFKQRYPDMDFREIY